MVGRAGKLRPPHLHSLSVDLHKQKDTEQTRLGLPESLTTDKQGIMLCCTLPKPTPTKQIQKQNNPQGVSSSRWE